jgi:hypothetical protein
MGRRHRRVGKEAGEDGLFGNAAVADDADGIDGLTLLGEGRMGRKQRGHGNEGQRQGQRQCKKPGEQRCDAPANGPGVRRAREMETCLIFTGLEPCVEHKFWCGP